MVPRRRAALRDLHEGRRPPRLAQEHTDESWAGTPIRVLVVAHVYYPELWDELAERVLLIPGPVDLAVTLVRGRGDHLAEGIRARFPGAIVRVVENRGRDLGPLLQVLDLVPGHDVVLKVHTKRSPHMRSGDTWRTDLLDGLCGSRAQIAQLLELFDLDPRIGLVAAPGNVLGREFLGNNGPRLRELVAGTHLTYDTRRLWFPAGSMFWARSDVLTPLADLGLTAADFGPETGAIDGTLPHALERYLGVIAESRGLAVVESSEAAALVAEARVARMSS